MIAQDFDRKGLGLAISQRLVKSHNGSIAVRSKVGEGTEFIIRLPALAEPRPDRLLAPMGTPSPDMLPATTTGNLSVSDLPLQAQEKRASRKERKRREKEKAPA